MTQSLVFKILPRADWDAACRVGSYLGSADDARDGFIHLSAADQVAGTAARHFAGCAGLVVVVFPADTLGALLRWEASRGGALFPHLYGPLPTGAACRVADLPLAADGVPQVPPDLSGSVASTTRKDAP